MHGSLVLLLAKFADVNLTWIKVLEALGLMSMLAFALTSLGVVIANHIRSFQGFGIFSNAVILLFILPPVRSFHWTLRSAKHRHVLFTPSGL